MKQDTPPNKQLPVVLIDTNIFGNLLDPKTLIDTYEILAELSKQYELSISKITIQEIISKGTKDISEIVEILFKTFRKFDIDDNVLIFGGLMNCVGIKGQFDSIIASTAFLNNSCILTANQKDFPEPCFKEIKCWSINYKDNGNRTAHLMIHLLTIDINKTTDKFNGIEYIRNTIDKSN